MTTTTQTLDLTSDARDAGTMITDRNTTVSLVKWDVRNNGRALTTLNGEPVRIAEIILSSDGRIFVGTIRQTRKGTDYVRNGYMWVSVDMLDATMADIIRATVESATVESAPVESAPVESAPVESAPVESAPVESAPVESAPVESAPVEMCNCEHIDHEDNGTHTPGVHVHADMAEPAGTQKAMYVGAVCDMCAETHMRPYLLATAEGLRHAIKNNDDSIDAPAPELPVSPSANNYECSAFLNCTRPAVGWINHPIMGAYPSCRECASILGETLGELCSDHDEWWSFPFDQVAYATPCNGTPSTDPRCPRCLRSHILQCAACQAECALTHDDR